MSDIDKLERILGNEHLVTAEIAPDGTIKVIPDDEAIRRLIAERDALQERCRLLETRLRTIAEAVEDVLTDKRSGK